MFGWGLFNAPMGDDEYIPAWYKIRDENGHWAIEKEYAEKGEREGWLTLDHYKYWDGEKGNVYRHTP